MVNHFEFAFDAQARTATLLGREYSLATLLRTVVFLGGYLLLRPYLLQLSGKFQERDHAREVRDDGDVSSPAATGRVAPGGAAGRGGDDDADDGDDESDAEDDGWGARARRRARAERRRISREQRAADEMEDQELAALLED